MRRAFFLLILVCSALLVAPAALRADVPAYKLGDVATEDVITPVALTVINPVATEALRAKEALKVPAVVRFRPQAADEAEAALRAAFTAARTNFADALYRTMKGKPESERAIGGELFLRAVESARRRAEGFPMLDELAPVWARDESDAAIQTQWAFRLRTVMSLPIIPGKAPAVINSKNSIRLVLVDNLDDRPTPEAVDHSDRLVKGSQLASQPAARSQLLKSFADNEQTVARYVGKFLTTNALVDVELTVLLRSRRTEGLCVTDNYEPAEAVVKKGQILDRKALAALSALREKTVIGTLQQKLAERPVTTPAEPDKHLITWIAGGFGVVVALLALILWRIRSRETASLLPVRVPQVDASGADTVWRERALTAEAKAEQARHAMRSGFTQWMREKVVQGLFHQRAKLLSAQQKAEVEMHALEQRLEQLQTPLQERISAYEKRIAELEKDLAAKGEENRELIKAKITFAKQKLSVERERSTSRFGINCTL